MRLLPALILLALFVLAGALPARAEVWNYLSGGPGGKRAAAFCELAAEGMACLSLGCSDREELAFSFQPPLPLPGDFTVEFSVDGGPGQAVDFDTPVNRGGPALALWTQDRDGPLAEALKRGRRAALSWEGKSGRQELELTLTGSARSIAQVMQSCPDPRARVADLMAHVQARMAPVCRRAGMAFAPQEGLIEQVDLDRDGREDAVIRWSRAGCGAEAEFCSGTDCDITFLRSDAGGGHTVVLTVPGYDYQVLDLPGFGPDLEVHAAPSACGRTDDNFCALIYHVRAGVHLEIVGRF
ncbi:hypothetical protein [Poseidonocella sp. HB161398]|uniref:hypothetical protein n=1 Tax=Poseidonocella sp. HB161398 TaxID=2320855 RepID=UPI001109D619|nr:hypothetical protein [Poseidonocella sp. HB161398]